MYTFITYIHMPTHEQSFKYIGNIEVMLGTGPGTLNASFRTLTSY